MASKLKKLWWLMLVFAVCNIAIALILFFGNKQKSPEESIKPIPQKNVYYTIGCEFTGYRWIYFL